MHELFVDFTLLDLRSPMKLLFFSFFLLFSISYTYAGKYDPLLGQRQERFLKSRQNLLSEIENNLSQGKFLAVNVDEMTQMSLDYSDIINIRYFKGVGDQGQIIADWTKKFLDVYLLPLVNPKKVFYHQPRFSINSAEALGIGLIQLKKFYKEDFEKFTKIIEALKPAFKINDTYPLFLGISTILANDLAPETFEFKTVKTILSNNIKSFQKNLNHYDYRILGQNEFNAGSESLVYKEERRLFEIEPTHRHPISNLSFDPLNKNIHYQSSDNKFLETIGYALKYDNYQDVAYNGRIKLENYVGHVINRSRSSHDYRLTEAIWKQVRGAYLKNPQGQKELVTQTLPLVIEHSYSLQGNGSFLKDMIDDSLSLETRENLISLIELISIESESIARKMTDEFLNGQKPQVIRVGSDEWGKEFLNNVDNMWNIHRYDYVKYEESLSGVFETKKALIEAVDTLKPNEELVAKVYSSKELIEKALRVPQKYTRKGYVVSIGSPRFFNPRDVGLLKKLLFHCNLRFLKE